MTFPALHLAPLGFLLVAATCWDVAKRRIPNVVVGTAALSGLIVQAVDRGALAVGSGLAAAVIVIALLYRAWSVGGIGGGDVKLAAAVAIWVGLGGLIRYTLGVAIAGGVVAAITYLFSTRAIKQEVKANLTLAAVGEGIPRISSHRSGRASVPYGVAIAAGAAFALW